jgi:hypothetical protein
LTGAYFLPGSIAAVYPTGTTAGNIATGTTLIDPDNVDIALNVPTLPFGSQGYDVHITNPQGETRVLTNAYTSQGLGFLDLSTNGPALAFGTEMLAANAGTSGAYVRNASGITFAGTNLGSSFDKGIIFANLNYAASAIQTCEFVLTHFGNDKIMVGLGRDNTQSAFGLQYANADCFANIPLTGSMTTLARAQSLITTGTSVAFSSGSTYVVELTGNASSVNVGAAVNVYSIPSAAPADWATRTLVSNFTLPGTFNTANTGTVDLRFVVGTTNNGSTLHGIRTVP